MYFVWMQLMDLNIMKSEKAEVSNNEFRNIEKVNNSFTNSN